MGVRSVPSLKSKRRFRLNRALLMSIGMGCAMGPLMARAQTTVCSSALRNTSHPQPRVVILRPRVRIWRDNGFSSRESEGASETVAAGFHGVLARTFEEKGYKLLLDPILMAQWEETPPHDGAVKALKDHFDSLHPTLGSPECSTILKTSLQADLKRGTDSSEFDVVVLARASASALTKKGKVIDAIGTIWMTGPDESLYFSIGVVDASTGVFLYYCKSTATGNYMDAPDSRLSRPIRKCLEQYFGGKP
jgi:hypothetical protein